MPQPTQSSTRRPRAATDPSAAAPKRGTSKRGAARASGTRRKKSILDDTARREMIAVAAYFHAEHRGFAPGDPIADWMQGEAEIAQRFPR